ncbi:MAG: TRAP transporter small permease [Lautropia sp.]
MIARGYRLLLDACGIFAGLLVGAMTALVGWDVVARNLGWPSVNWVLDVTEYMLPLATCIAAPWLMYQNQHVRLDVLNMVLSPRTLAAIDKIASAVGAVVSAVIAWYGIAVMLDSRAAGSLVMKSLVFPEWWVYWPVPIGFTLLTIECVRRLLHGPGGASQALDSPELAATSATAADATAHIGDAGSGHGAPR